MRRLTIHRKKALAGFAVPYFCFIDTDMTSFCGKMPHEDFITRADENYAVSFKNGESKTMLIDDEQHVLSAVIWRQVGNYVMLPALVPAGTEDLSYSLITDYNGNDVLEFYLRRDEEVKADE